MTGRSLLYYTVDCKGLIVDLAVQWDTFAAGDEGYSLEAAAILGTPLQSHIHGDETRAFVNRIVANVRASGRERTVMYRCDAPDMKRFMAMVLTSGDQGKVTLTHRLLRVDPLPVQLQFKADRAADSVRCSMCNRLRHGGHWHEPEEALSRGLLRAEHANLVIYKVCGDCRSVALEGEPAVGLPH